MLSETAMAAAATEAGNESCHGMQMTKESAIGAATTQSTTSNTAPNTNRTVITGSEEAATVATGATPSTASTISTAPAADGNSGDDDDATMQTASVSPAMSFDTGDDEFVVASTAETATTGSDFGSGLTVAASPTAATNGGIIQPSDPDITVAMPQWKKELIQRRKANIARTIGANQLGACSMKGTSNSSTTTMAGGTAPGTLLSPTSPVLSIAKNFCNDSISARGNGVASNSGHSIGVNNGVNARTPDIIQHDASSGGHYTACSLQQQHQQQLPCVDNNNSSQVAVPGPIFAKPKTSFTGVGTGSGSEGSKCTNGGKATTTATTRGSGTCLTTSQQNESSRPTFSGRQSQSQSQQQSDSVVSQVSSSSSIPSQLHSRLDVERSAGESSSQSLSPPQPQSEPCNFAATGTPSFIKNPYVNKSTNKFSKYKSSSVKSSANANSVPPNGINNSAKSSSPSSVTSASTSGSSRKMVAAQELSDTNDTFDDFDPSEELQYGPGIVSKLRCRYLSLALRQSAGKQRPALDNLRRATSLNNLLDDDDRGSNSSCTTATDHTASSAHVSDRPNSENMGKSPDEFVATFQKNLKVSDKQRSWHTKRGNDSLKRARSVEALLVYGDKAWENDGSTVTSNGIPVQMRYSYMQPVEPAKSDISSIGSSTEVTIEDKIISVRERSALNEKPPKKISPFMDETERPPPDVVKQTLKIFEASANRRGRGLSRNNNCNGEVATKVRNYKSIISQEKPPIIFPKPPLSPKKNFRKPSTPPGSLDIVPVKRISNNQQQTTVNNSFCNNANNKKSPTSGQLGSPTSSISKKFASELDAAPIVDSQPSVTAIGTTAEPKIGSPPIPSARTNIPFRHSSKNESTPIRSNSNGDGSQSPQTPDIIPRKIFESGPNFGAVDSPVTQLTKQIERLKIESPMVPQPAPETPMSPTVGGLSPIAKLPQKSKPSSESEEDDDDLDGETPTKRISKSALENISKAGTTQQFNFSSVNKSSHIGSKSPLPTAVTPAVNGSSNATTTASAHLATITAAASAKQVGVIRPLIAEPKQQQQQQPDSSKLKQSSPNATPATPDFTSHTDEIATAKARDNLVISNLSQQQQQQQQQVQQSPDNITNNLSSKTNNSFSNNNSNSSIKTSIDADPVPAPSTVLQPPRPTLTSREIEKNLINTKKNEEANLLEAANNSDNGVKWQFAKKKPRSAGAAQQQQQATQNTMIFNFKDRKEVPDYIENDGLLFRRKRELPKPNESGFVLLGDLSLETSTDPDDEWTMGPPSPCDVEFENANIIIDGKSSIRIRSRDVSLRVQFDDTLTSTFEYPSESSFFDDPLTDNANIPDNMGHIVTANTTATSTTAVAANSATTEEIIKNPGQKLLGSMSLGSAPLGSYIPMKAQINTHFELGVTRSPDTDDEFRKHSNNTIASKTTTTTTNGNSSDNETTALLKTTNASCNSNGVDYILNGSSGCNNDEPESLQYLKPATDDLTVAYSEGTQKTDLLY